MSDVVNGRPSWISATNAIWSNPDNPTNWVIGKLEAIGTNFGYIHANGMFFGPKKTDDWTFRYRIELTLNKMDKNDVIVECLFEKCERQIFFGAILINIFAIIMTNILSFYKVQCADDIKGLPDTNVEFNDNGVDHNPTKKKTNKFLKVGKMAWQALKSLRKPLTGLAKDLVNESKPNYKGKVQIAPIYKDSTI